MLNLTQVPQVPQEILKTQLLRFSTSSKGPGKGLMFDHYLLHKVYKISTKICDKFAVIFSQLFTVNRLNKWLDD